MSRFRLFQRNTEDPRITNLLMENLGLLDEKARLEESLSNAIQQILSFEDLVNKQSFRIDQLTQEHSTLLGRVLKMQRGISGAIDMLTAIAEGNRADIQDV